MPENENSTVEGRHLHMQRFKRNFIVMLPVAVPIVLCIILLVKVYSLSGALYTLSSHVEDLTRYVVEQQRKLDTLTTELQVRGEENIVVSEPMSSGQEQFNIDEIAPSEQEQQQHQATHKVYLTFDDGPSIYTDDILEILDRYGVKATFFVVGKDSDTAKESLTMIVDGGHTLGMHSYSHKYAELYQSMEDFANDFVQLRSYLYEVTGVESMFYRFPGGSSNTVSDIDMQEFADYLESQGVQFYDWNIASGDGDSVLLSVDTLVRNSLQGIGENETSIILFHDSGDKRTTVEALPIIIESILAMEDTEILPITEETMPVQHIH